MNPKSIPFLSLASQHSQIRSSVAEALLKVYDKNTFIMGDELQAFESAFARMLGVNYCIGVGNGLDALTLALRSCDISEGDEVIVPAHTFLATWLAVTQSGARVIPIEPDGTLNIDVSKIENAITSKTKAILPVHLYGQPCDMDVIQRIAARHTLHIIEDNAQAHGAKWNEQYTGSFGTVSATSFYPAKNLGALGDGGAVATSDESKASLIRRLRNYGFSEKGVASDQGINSRLDEMQAAVLRIKLDYLLEWTNERRRMAALYYDRLNEVDNLTLPVVNPKVFHVFHLFVIQTPLRDELKTFLGSRGIETMIHYPIPPHLQQAYKELKFKKGTFPKAEKAASCVLSLPLWPGMTDDQIFYITDMIIRFFKKQ